MEASKRVGAEEPDGEGALRDADVREERERVNDIGIVDIELSGSEKMTEV